VVVGAVAVVTIKLQPPPPSTQVHDDCAREWQYAKSRSAQDAEMEIERCKEAI